MMQMGLALCNNLLFSWYALNWHQQKDHFRINYRMEIPYNSCEKNYTLSLIHTGKTYKNTV